MVYTKASAEVVVLNNVDVVTASVTAKELSALGYRSLQQALDRLGFRADGQEGVDHLRQMIDIWGTDGLASRIAIRGDVGARHLYCDLVGNAVQSSFSADSESDSFDKEWDDTEDEW